MRLLIALLPCLLLSGCPVVTCTTEARVSVQVTITDQAGNIVDGATVTYDSDDGTGLPCDEGSAGTWACGYEVDGEITVHAEAPFLLPASDTVTVDSDECHVISESLTLVLEEEMAPG